MAPAQLARLRPQITALSTLFEQPDSYISALTALLQMYRSEIDFSTAGITPHSLIKRFNVPEIVITQLSISFNHLCHVFPDQAITIANRIWEKDQFEFKQIAILLLSNLEEPYRITFYNFVSRHLSSETENPVFSILLDTINSSEGLRNDPRWIEIIDGWIFSQETQLKKYGLRAMTDLVAAEKEFPRPQILSKLKPIFAESTLPLYGELLNLIGQLTEISVNETSAILISLGIQNPNPQTHKFIRKCLNFFPDELALRIKDSIRM